MSIEIDTKQLDNEYFRPSSPDLSSKNAIEHEEPCSLQVYSLIGLSFYKYIYTQFGAILCKNSL